MCLWDIPAIQLASKVVNVRGLSRQFCAIAGRSKNLNSLKTFHLLLIFDQVAVVAVQYVIVKQFGMIFNRVEN